MKGKLAVHPSLAAGVRANIERARQRALELLNVLLANIEEIERRQALPESEVARLCRSLRDRMAAFDPDGDAATEQLRLLQDEAARLRALLPQKPPPSQQD